MFFFSKRDLKCDQRVSFCLFLGKEIFWLHCLEVYSSSNVEETNQKSVDFKSKDKLV